ncbi:MAG: lipocalin family protein [Alistipes sp.]|nr:lipocalin family protein [Alistipes sp.]
MKNLLKRAFLALMALAVLTACSDDDVYQEPTLDVTPNNIAGTWCLQSWSGGEMMEGSYVYIDFVRADRTYTLYQNLDSQQLRTITGSYYIETDAEYGAVIRGNYDYGNGEWSHRYIVTDLTAERMVWTAKDNADDVSVYVRKELPEGFKPAEE